jgi:hypothetical protein
VFRVGIDEECEQVGCWVLVVTSATYCKKGRLSGWGNVRSRFSQKRLKLREQPDGGLLYKLVFGVCVGHGEQCLLGTSRDREARLENGKKLLAGLSNPLLMYWPISL